MTFNDVLGLLHNVQGSGTKRTARCPAHEDKQNSLSIAQGDKGIIIHCHAGCDTERIVKAMGLSMSDLFYEQKKPPTEGSGKREIEKTYDYEPY